MQPEDLRTLKRPLVRREYLGEELGGTGARIHHWVPLDDTTLLRVSFGALESLLTETEEDAGGPDAAVAERQDVGDLSLSGSITALAEIRRGILRAGASARSTPSFEFVDEPFGSLDSDCEAALLRLFRRFSEPGLALLWVTHHPQASRALARVLWHVGDGCVRVEAGHAGGVRSG